MQIKGIQSAYFNIYKTFFIRILAKEALNCFGLGFNNPYKLLVLLT
jgi:hypothetical protein